MDAITPLHQPDRGQCRQVPHCGEQGDRCSTLPAATRELVKIRASQINGCSFCLDMHSKDAAHAGESSIRLHLIAAWREAKVFTDAERAAPWN
ncbi:carboxymuconolactone decarboxylase family protein [Spirillospora sp. CA-294931]|uniref:carboxymuconolactone decarboxylase family protein n=1 Tax=Spirillospora sp. CA-294931 TaxID=3240042 RepID=UPI003D8F2B52